MPSKTDEKVSMSSVVLKPQYLLGTGSLGTGVLPQQLLLPHISPPFPLSVTSMGKLIHVPKVINEKKAFLLPKPQQTFSFNAELLV